MDCKLIWICAFVLTMGVASTFVPGWQSLEAQTAAKGTNAKAEAHKGSPKSLELNEKGVAAVKAKDFKQAEEFFRQALAADSYNLTAVFNLAGMYAANGKEEAAVALLEDYVKKHDRDPGLFARLADAYFGTKKIDEAAKAYERALALDPRYPNIKARLATIYGLQHRLPDAERLLAQAVQENPRDGQLMANLSSLQLANGKIDASIETAKRALQLKPTSEVYITLGTAYELSKNYKNALISFQRAVDFGDSRPELKKKIVGLKEVVGD